MSLSKRQQEMNMVMCHNAVEVAAKHIVIATRIANTLKEAMGDAMMDNLLYLLTEGGAVMDDGTSEASWILHILKGGEIL